MLRYGSVALPPHLPCGAFVAHLIGTRLSRHEANRALLTPVCQKRTQAPQTALGYVFTCATVVIGDCVREDVQGHGGIPMPEPPGHDVHRHALPQQERRVRVAELVQLQALR
jgi:hypothetical protein